MAIAYLGLGSNLGNREQNILQAIKLLEDHSIRVTKRAHIIETEPEGGPPQCLFLNTVIEVTTSLDPHELLSLIKTIEQKLGRTKTVRNGPRTIDMDVLLYDDIALNEPDLIIPHPRMHQRNFVLQPLKEIAPQHVEGKVR
ncbi:MAG: 2-amino-4-hydroxy-6-hydroxymethyldihydropteridine diphosphokinase [Candidatus Omnitrophota bacterium]